jgi:hypothetical protein
MHACSSSAAADELPSMMATLCVYENWFGPFHTHTLQMMTLVAIAQAQRGAFAEACRLLERVLRDIQRLARPNHNLRLQAATTLRDCWLQQRVLLKATAAQKEVLNCQIERFGVEHPEAVAARKLLASLLLNTRSGPE